MSSVEKAKATQLNNIQAKTGKSLDELSSFIRNSGLTKHSEILEMLMREFGLGYGDANALVHYALKSDGARTVQEKGLSTDGVLGEIYSGAKASLRPIHDRLMAEIDKFGTFEIAPRKGYFSLRRKKQYAMIGPATNTRIEVGLNVKGLAANKRLVVMPPGGMCNFKVRVSEMGEVDDELVAWLKQAFDSAG